MNFEQEKIIEQDSDSDLEKFHKEIQELKEAEEREMQKREAEGSTGSVHLRDLNPEELTTEDAAVYAKFKNWELTQEEFYAWREKINDEAQFKAASDPSYQKDNFLIKDSRHSFMQYIANKIGIWQVWEKKKQELSDFRKEIARLKEEEIKKMEKKEEYDPHLAAILNVQKLTPRDMEIFKKFKEGMLKENSEEFREYRQEILRECQKHFRQEILKHKKLKEIIEKTTSEEGARSLEVEAYLRFQSVFSRTNFLAWIHNKMFEVALKESRARRKARQKKEDI